MPLEDRITDHADAQLDPGGLRALLLTADELVKLPPPEPLVGDLLPVKSLAVLWGRWGSAKSFVALDWALCVSGGLPWQGQEVRKGAVLYIAAEGLAGLGQRVEAWKTAFHAEPGNMKFLPRRIDLRDHRQVDALAALAEADQLVLVVIDTLNRSIPGGDENNSRDMGAAIDAADRLRQIGATVLLIHHGGKDGQVIRGHSSLEGAVDVMIEARRDDDRIELRTGKAKDAAEPAPVHMQLTTVELGDGRTSCVLWGRLRGRDTTGPDASTLELVRDVMRDTFRTIAGTPNQIMEATKTSRTRTYAAIEALLKTGAIENIGTAKAMRLRWRDPDQDAVS
jgi:AAA domain